RRIREFRAAGQHAANQQTPFIRSKSENDPRPLGQRCEVSSELQALLFGELLIDGHRAGGRGWRRRRRWDSLRHSLHDVRISQATTSRRANCRTTCAAWSTLARDWNGRSHPKQRRLVEVVSPSLVV